MRISTLEIKEINIFQLSIARKPSIDSLNNWNKFVGTKRNEFEFKKSQDNWCFMESLGSQKSDAQN